MLSMHKLVMGDGYTYLTRQVAAGDVGLSASDPAVFLMRITVSKANLVALRAPFGPVQRKSRGGCSHAVSANEKAARNTPRGLWQNQPG